MSSHDYDWVVVGSGFGGSVSALRLAEKGYRVLVVEKGRWHRPEDFPRTNWDLRRWLWLPFLRFFGIFRVSLFRHITVLSGVGVGGGSLVYANVLAEPGAPFFEAPGWGDLADWQEELRPYYDRVREMLGAAPNPRLEAGDIALRDLAEEMGIPGGFAPTQVAVHFGEPGVEVPDPYFGGRGPARAGCTFCGGCMTGCRHNAKNTLDRNYLYLAQALGTEIRARSQVTDVVPLPHGTGGPSERGEADGSDGYAVTMRPSAGRRGGPQTVTTRGVVFAGGVLGTVPLLLRLKETSLPRLSDRVGGGVHTNSESLVGVTTMDRERTLSDGVAIGAILETAADAHLEVVRYGAGSGFWRLVMSPLVRGGNAFVRIARALGDLVLHPIRNAKVFFVRDWARHTQILLFMRTHEGTLRFELTRRGMRTRPETGMPPTPFLPEVLDRAEAYAEKVDGKPMVLLAETLMGIPTTAHILGGCVMGAEAREGVVDAQNRIFGYPNMLVCDGSMISANPSVNPSLTIAAISERAMDKIPPNPYARSGSDPGSHRTD